MLLLAAASLAAAAASSAAAPSLPASPEFSATAAGAPLFVYMGTVPGAFGDGVINASFVHVALPTKGGAVTMEITVLNHSAPVTSAGLRPRGGPKVTLLSPSTLSFTVSEPGHYILELDGEYTVGTIDTGLMVFVDAADPAPPAQGDASVVFFGPGVHMVDGGVLTLHNDSLVYLAPGAVVLTKIVGSGVHNVTIRGSGVIAAEWLPGHALPFTCRHCGCPGVPGIVISNASDVTVQGITLIHVNGYVQTQPQRVHPMLSCLDGRFRCL